MSSRGTEFKVGLFTIVALVVIAYMFFFLSPELFENKPYATYYTMVKNASGIVAKTQVKTNGVVVGKVSAVDLDAEHTKISFAIEKSVKIPVGSVVAIKEKGLLGDVFLEITRADSTGQYLEEGSLVPYATQVNSLSSLIDVAGNIGGDIKSITSSLSGALGGTDGQEKIKSFIANMVILSESIKGIAQENRENLRTLIENFREVSANLKPLLANDSRQKIVDIIHKLDRTITSVTTVMERVEKGQGTLGKLINSDQTITEIDAALKDIREVIAPAKRLEVSVDYHGELRQGSETQHYFNAYLQTRPDKFYLVGLTDTHVTTRETTYESLEPNPSSDSIPDGEQQTPRTIRERINERQAMRFNLQFGKRWGTVQLRFGLFESSGGLAGDGFLWDDRIKLSFEAFDWNYRSSLRRTAHFKTYATILFFKHLYTLVGLDDLSRLNLETNKVERHPHYFMGLGLSFRDEDLKALFGTAALARP